MKGDFTRSTFRPERHYTGVRMQQGRVQLDADWNEQLDIDRHLHGTTTGDVIGPCGAPKEGGGFAVTATAEGTDLILSAGRLYAGGTLCEIGASASPVLEVAAGRVRLATLLPDGRQYDAGQWLELSATGAAAVRTRVAAVDLPNLTLTVAPELSAAEVAALQAAPDAAARRLTSYATQPDLPRPPHTDVDGAGRPVLAAADGTYLAYVDAWSRHVTAIEDDGIREAALGGPDTATRTQTVWQAKLARLGAADADLDCSTVPDWAALAPASTGQLRARAQPETTSADLCTIPPGAGYRRLENQLYRVEVHTAGGLGAATFKWSRENGSVVVPWLDRNGDRLTLASLGRDRPLGFAGGQWVELTDDTHELAGTPGTLVRVTNAVDRTLTVDVTTATGSLDRLDFPVNPKVRRWDDPAGQRAAVRPAADDGWLALEDGVEIRLDDGTYNTGDYWLIPARTAQGDVVWPRHSSGQPLARPPEGIAHTYCRLALVRVAAGAVTVEDCRDRFPTLTAICAEDVCFDNRECHLPGEVETVQEALDRLCAERDLRHHNKHLHGWGIVCGLQVVCGPTGNDGVRRLVSVRPGYALDCEGNDLFVGKPTGGGDPATVDILALVDRLAGQNPNAPPLDRNGDGDVSLILLRGSPSKPRFQIEPYRPEPGSPWMAAGTLLFNFYNHCIKPVEDFLRASLTPRPDAGPAGPATQLSAAVTNLLAQPANPATGQHIFLSRREHDIMLRFYVALRAMLTSETFCAMFEKARPFPDYFADQPGLDTILGTGNHTRLRIRPGGTEAYSVGPGLSPLKPSTTLNRFDLSTQALVAQIDPLAGAEIPPKTDTDTGAGSVQDVAFSPDGRLIYVVVPTRGGQNTFFRVGDIARTGISWRPMVTICGVKLVTLATTPADPANVYAIGAGQGLYRINPQSPDPNATPVVPFNAAGHLVVADDGQAVATAGPPGDKPGRYTSVVRLRLPAATRTGPDLQLPGTGADDVAMVGGAVGGPQTSVYAVIEPSRGVKAVVGFDMQSGQPLGPPVTVDHTAIRLQPFRVRGTNAPVLVVATDDGYCLRLIDPINSRLLPDYLLPMQVGPVAMAADPTGQRLYVLNDLSNTIVVVPGALLSREFRFPLAALAAYRKGVLEAFTDLFAGFLQYLKDCFCDQLLVDCPDCTGDERLFLASVSIRGRQVYKVCNFSKRKYVKSFPTVGYWMSLVPIGAALHRLLEQFCCLVLPDVFGRFHVAPVEEPEPENNKPRVRAAAIRGGLASAQAFDVIARIREALDKLNRVGRMAGGALVDPVGPLATPTRVRAGDLVDQSTDVAEAVLADAGVDVTRAPYDPSVGIDVAANLGGLLRNPRPGDRVTLYEDDGRVVTYAVGPAGAASMVAEVESLKSSLAEHRDLLAQRDDQLVALRQSMERLESRQDALETTATKPPGRRPKPS